MNGERLLRAPGSLAPLLAVALLATPPAALASSKGISLAGRAGASYFLFLNGENTASVINSVWGLTGDISISGGYFNPRVLRWSASADYDGSRGILFQARSTLDRVGFRANTILLGGSNTPITLSASRRFYDMTAQSGPITSTGTSRTTSFSGTAVLKYEQLPSVFLTLGRQLTDTQRLGEAPTSEAVTRLSTGAAQALPLFEYTVNYDTSWHRGTYAELNYQAHSLMANMAAPLSEGIRLYLNERYYLRFPTIDAATNPRYDSDNVDVGLQWRHGGKANTWFGYNYGHNLITILQNLVSEHRGHALSARTRYRWTEELTLLGNITATSALSRLGAIATEGLEQRAGTGVEWQRAYPWGTALAAGTVSAGLVEPTTGGLFFSHGVDANTAITRGWSRFTGSLHYLVSYNNGGAALRGWSLLQQLRAEGNYPLLERTRLRALLSANSGRRDHRLLGTFLNRSISLLVELSSFRYSAQLSAGLGDGLSDALTNPVYSDGLFLPADYNTHHRYAMLGGSTSFDHGRLILMGNIRVAYIRAPWRPSQFEEGLSFVGSYTLGKFRLSLEERLAIGGPGGSRQLTNLLMLRLTRGFDWGF